MMATKNIPNAMMYSKLKSSHLHDKQFKTQCTQSRDEIVDDCLSDILSQRKPAEIKQMKVKLKERALLLDKAQMDRLNRKKKKRSKKLVSSKLTKSLGLHTIPKEGQKYEYFVPLNQLWRGYIKSALKGGGNNFALRADERLLKIDYHGAEFKVVNAKCSSFISLKGIVAKETKNTFILITMCDELKCVPKKSTIFMCEIEGYRVMINGDAVLGRPAMRSNKKIKGNYFGNLLLDCLEGK